MYADFSKKQIFKKKRNSAQETCIGQAGFFPVFRHKNPSVARRIANRKYQKKNTKNPEIGASGSRAIQGNIIRVGKVFPKNLQADTTEEESKREISDAVLAIKSQLIFSTHDMLHDIVGG